MEASGQAPFWTTSPTTAPAPLIGTIPFVRVQIVFFNAEKDILLLFLTECIVYFLNTVHCYNILEEYCYYEIQLHKGLCDFAVQKGYCCLKEGLPPPPTHIKGNFLF